jgi:hypothetical protein
MHHPSLSDNDFPKSAPDATMDGTQSARPGSDNGIRRVRCPTCHHPIQLSDDQSEEVLCPGCGSSFRLRDAEHARDICRFHGRPLELTSEVLDLAWIGYFGEQ